MRVDDSLVQIQAPRHHHVEGHAKKDGLDSIKERRDHGHHNEAKVHGHDRHDSVEISEEAKARFESMKKRSEETRERHFSVPGGLDPKALLNRLVLGAFGGKDINVTGLLDQGQDSAPASQAQAAGETSPVVAPDQVVQPGDAQAAAGAAGFSASVEQLSFSASGTIKTADGEEVGFTIELNVTKASMSGYAAGAAQDVNGVSVNFGGSSAELYSMSFEFNIASDEEDVQSGVGNLKVDKPETDSVADDDDAHEAQEVSGEHSLVSDVHDFMKLLRRAEFTSTYLSFSRTTIEASSAFASNQPIDALAASPVDTGATMPVDLVA